MRVPVGPRTGLEGHAVDFHRGLARLCRHTFEARRAGEMRRISRLPSEIGIVEDLHDDILV